MGIEAVAALDILPRAVTQPLEHRFAAAAGLRGHPVEIIASVRGRHDVRRGL
jgi:hypothetical protein